MTENIAEKINNLKTTESGNIQTDVLAEIKSKVIISDKSERNYNLKKMISKNVQVDIKELSESGIVTDLKYEMYWQELAESKRIELEDALEENERLCKLKETLIKENIHYQKLLEEASSFVEVLKDVVEESPDDTGIDVRDVNDSDDFIDANDAIEPKESTDVTDSIDANDTNGGDGFNASNDLNNGNGVIDIVINNDNDSNDGEGSNGIDNPSDGNDSNGGDLYIEAIEFIDENDLKETNCPTDADGHVDGYGPNEAIEVNGDNNSKDE